MRHALAGLRTGLHDLGRHRWFGPGFSFALLILGTLRDLSPIILVVTFFQIVVLEQPLPDLERILVGLVFVMVGLALFIKGLEMGLFPVGENLARDFAAKGNLWWLLGFGFALGFGATIAEPALIAVTQEAARVAVQSGALAPGEESRYALNLRYTVALAVGFALALGVVRIIRGWPLHWMIIGGYAVVVALTAAAPPTIVGIAYDSGGVTTSVITVPLIAALGIGLSRALRGRNPMIDGFGLIALASLVPIVFVLLYGIVL